jgi:hypothetical protein
MRRGLVVFDRDWPNIEIGQAWARAHASFDNAAAELCIGYTRAAPNLLELRLEVRQMITWLDAARRLGRRQPEGATLGNLAVAYGRLGEFQRSIDLSNQYLNIARETGDADARSARIEQPGNWQPSTR